MNTSLAFARIAALRRRCLPLVTSLCLAGGSLAAGSGPALAQATAVVPTEDGIVVAGINGRVEVRRGVEETWAVATPGLKLRREDSIRTGPDGSAVLVAPDGRFSLPADALLDLNDLRQVAREELLLSLTMDNVRSLPTTPARPRPGVEPSVRVMHGSDLAAASGRAALDEAAGVTAGAVRQRVEGARALYNQSYFGSSALVLRRAMRQDDDLRSTFDVRLLVARSFEQLELTGEALSEYQAISRLPGLDPTRARLVAAKIDLLRTP